MRALALACVLALPACALAHERGTGVDTGPPDTGPMPSDAGPITSCTEFWRGLPSCPASPGSVIGQPCFAEGATCGVHCCEPGPPIGCVEGRWTAVDHPDDCRGVRCGAPSACFEGQCAFGRVCLVATGEVASQPTCVVPPAPITQCTDAPPGSLTPDPMACTTCSCAGEPPTVTLDCACC